MLQQNLITEVDGEFLELHRLIFGLTCSCGTVYAQVYAFLNYVLLTEFATGGLQCSRDIAR